ncbi:hypothetical protein ACG7TL_000950 [Trametes sanguinea]
MAPSTSLYAAHSHSHTSGKHLSPLECGQVSKRVSTSGSPLDSTVKGWGSSSSLMSALGEPSSSQGLVPHQWHIATTPLPEGTPCSSPLPSPPFSPDSSCASSSSSNASSPALQSATPRARTTTASRRGAKSADYIPRPRNAFMIFRSEYCMDVKESQVEHDHRMISKILGEVWRNLEPERKEHYKQLAAEEKRVHTIKYPNYRFSPQQRTEKPKKRNVKRNGATDKQRCEKVAKLLLEGKGGNALKAEVEKFDMSIKVEDGAAGESSADYATGVFDPRTWVSPSSSGSSSGSSTPSSCPPITPTSSECPAFRSPLLRPSVPQTPCIRSPIDIPNVANFETLSPLSPLRIPPIEAQVSSASFAARAGADLDFQAQAPVLAPVPLPPVGEQNVSNTDHSSMYSSVTSGLGLEVSQPQGELKMNHMYTPRTAAMVMSAQDYTYRHAPFSHQLVSPLDTGLPGPSSYVPDFSAQFQADQQFSLGYAQEGPSAASYDNGWSSAQYSTAQYGTATHYDTGETQQYPQGFVFPSGSTCATAAAHANDATALHTWTYGQNSGLEGEPQPASGWMRY